MQLTKGAIGNLINRYKAVLKKCHLMNTFGSLAVAGMLVMGGAGVAVAADPDKALEGENNYDSQTTSSVNHLMGGWLVTTPETAGKAQGDITLTVTGGTIGEIIGGSYAKSLAANGDSLLTVKHGDITTTISGNTSSAEFVVGGSKVAGGAGANLETGKTTLTITGGTFGTQKTDDYELVMGGNYAKSPTAQDAQNISATTQGAKVDISGGTFSTSVVGGSVAHNWGSYGKQINVTDKGATSVTINGGTFNPSESTLDDTKGGINLKAAVIGGGLAYGANTSSVLDAGSSVTIDGEKTAVNGKVVAGSVVAEGGYAAVVHGNTTLTMQNGTVSDDLVGGSMAKATSTGQATATVAGNSGVQVDKGTLAGVVGGGLAETYSHAKGGSAASSVNGTSSVTINGGTINGIAYGAVASNAGTSSAAVVGGGMANGEGASASVTNTNVTIADGTINGKVVAGGAAVNGGTTTAGGNTLLTMTGGEVSGDLIGGNLLEKGGKEDSAIAGSTVNVKGGMVAGEIYGGSYVRNTTATSKVDNTTVNISGGTIGAKVPQGWAQYVVGGGKAMSDATTTESSVTNTATVNISGGNITRGAVVGGGFARAQGAGGSATANVKDSVVNLTGGSLVGVVGGGLAENLGTADSSATATADVTNANLTIDGNATVNGIIYKGNDGKETPSSAAVIGGGLAYSQNGSAATASVGTANTTINGGTINGDVYAGGMADGTGGMADGTGATANVTNANLTIKGGTINGNVYAGGYALNKGTANVTTAIITLDGTGAKVNGDFEGNKTSTLTFNNYDGTFEKVAIGFGTLAVAENSNVYVDALVSGQRGSDHPNTGFFGAPTPTPQEKPNPTGDGFTITGGGTITTEEFHVSPDAPVTIEHGNVVADEVRVQSATLTVGGQSTSASLTVNKELITEDKNSTPTKITVDNLGTVTLGKAIVLDDTGELLSEDALDKIQTQVNTGGTLKVNGLGGKKLTEEQLITLKGLTTTETGTGDGLLDLGGADLGEAGKPNADGTVSYDKVAGITTDSLKGKTVQVTKEQNKKGISGGFKAVQLTVGKELNAKGTLVLNGSAEGGNLVQDKGGNVASLRIGGQAPQATSVVTLGDDNAANKGTLGNVILNAGNNNAATLNVVGNGKAEFTIGNVTANNSQNTVNVAGATLNTGDITVDAGSNLYKDIDLNVTNGTVNSKNAEIANATVTNGAVNARGDLTVTNAKLANGALTAAVVPAAAEGQQATGGSITISDKLSGQGSVVAEKTLTLTAGYTGADGSADVLTLQAGETITATGKDLKQADNGKLTVVAGGTIEAADISATNVAAKKLTAGAVAVDGGTLNLTGTGTADASTVDSLKLTKAGISVADLTVSNDVIMTNGSAGMIDKLQTNGNFTIGEAGSDGVSLVVKEMTTKAGTTMTFDPDWGHASNNDAIDKLNYDAAAGINHLNNALQVGRNSYVALGTTDQSWLPSVVQGGLREGGVETVLGLAKPLVIDSTTTSSGVVTGSIELNSDARYGGTWTGTDNTATFGDNSLLVVDGNAIFGDKVAITFNPDPTVATGGTLTVSEGAKLLVTDAVAGQTYTIVGNVTNPATNLAGWKNNGMTSTTDMISLGDAVFTPGTGATTGKVTTSAERNDAHTVFPNLSDGMANAVNDLYTGHAGAAGKPRWDYADVNSADMGVRFLSRATDNRFLGMDKEAAAESIESAARIAFAGAAPQMTKMASDAGTNSVVNRLGFANPADGAQAMDAEGKIVDRNTTGFALWIAPLWQSQHGWGLDAGNMDYGFNGNLGGVSLGADYTFENAIRAGITFNIGGGYAESSGGDLSSTENRMNFWGLGAYAGWNYENFGVMADVSYTSTWNQLKQDLDSRLGMGNKLEADVQASAISAGLRAEYLLQTSAMDIIPHIGVRYMSLNTWGYDVDTHGGTVLEGDSLHQDIWTFPIGVTFSKDFALDSGWNFKPSLDFTVIPAAGDIKAKHDVHFTGLPGTYEVETQMMDYLTWQGGVGLELANDNMSIGVNYTLQAGQHTTGHGVFGSFRYEF